MTGSRSWKGMTCVYLQLMPVPVVQVPNSRSVPLQRFDLAVGTDGGLGRLLRRLFLSAKMFVAEEHYQMSYLVL